MNAAQIFLAGIAPDHIPALLAPFALLFVWILRSRLVTPDRLVTRDFSGIPLPTKVFVGLMMISAAVHVALPLGHHDNLVLAVAFLGSGVAYGWLGYRALNGKRYKFLSVLLILATLIAYLSIVLAGNEAPDQVGIATAMVELGALALCLVTEQPRRVRKVLGNIAFVFVFLLTGAFIWGGALAQHNANGAGGVNHVGHVEHDHAGGARAQAGVLMAPHDDSVSPTPAQLQAAADLAAKTMAALVKYTDVRAAIAAGYTATLSRTGYGVHLENKAYSKDGRILDPEHPEQLMYAIADGKATLLSAVYTVPYAGRPAPSPGGPLTHWHSHNICLTVLPPGFTIVDPFGSCPSLAVKLATPLMMHVWVVDNPGGPYVDGEPDAWTRAFNLAHGVPFHW
jgi:hypothetical protein